MDAATRFSEYLARNRLRLTQERRTILEEMLQIRGHFDADQLLIHFRRKGRTVSRATLYRTLTRLVEAGLVHKIEMAQGQARYEIMFGRHHHDHMICLACGRIIEFESREIERAQEEVCRKKGFRMTGHMHQIRGFCSQCSSRAGATDGAPHAAAKRASPNRAAGARRARGSSRV
jgi:Fur family transcriptional regulator, ferric uptake regulator